MPRSRLLLLALWLGAAACSAAGSASSSDGGPTRRGEDLGASTDLATVLSDGSSTPGDAAPSCTTRITYGSAWLHAVNHPAQDDVVSGAPVTWDGTCTDDGTNSYAILSNGWKPIFAGHGACVIALDYQGACGAPAQCTTRIRYGSAWLPAPNHPASYDDVPGRVFSDGSCQDSGGTSYQLLSNGWMPTFQGSDACRVSFTYTQCGGLYDNPVIPFDCPDPGVLRDGNQYILSCTSGDEANAYPLFTSTDLVNWTPKGHIFPAGAWPAWADADFWAPEIHKVGNRYIAYYSARNKNNQLHCIGAATSTSPTGPFQDLGHPLVSLGTNSVIDANEFNDSNGTPYLIWKVETGTATIPIHGQQLAADGLSLTGPVATLITNDRAWEGPLVEGPFLVEHAGSYYLFYSANPYDTVNYAVGVARAASPLGPYQKPAGPILSSVGSWSGPGHCSVVDTPAGDSYMVYHAWEAGHVGNGNGPGRLVLDDAIVWQNGWPTLPAAPSQASRPMP